MSFNNTPFIAKGQCRTPWCPNNLSSGVCNRTNKVLANINSTEPEDFTHMWECIVRKIQYLPPLPKTVRDLNALKNSEEIDNQKLLKIILTDPMLAANILKVSNSAAYGYSKHIKTEGDALKILWFNIVSRIALSTAMTSYLKHDIVPDLKPYGIDMEAFAHISMVQSSIIEMWTEPKIKNVKKDLPFAAFMQEIGIIVISMILTEKHLIESFKEKVNESALDISQAEESILGHSSAEITSLLFAQWKFDDTLTDFISNSDKPEHSKEAFRSWSQALKIAKILSPMSNTGITPETIAKATDLVQEYGFNMDRFEELLIALKKAEYIHH